MGNFTTHLKLIKPDQNATNWGNALNSNMDRIDANWGTLNSRVQELQAQLGEMNYIQISNTQGYAELGYDEENKEYYLDLGGINDTNNELDIADKDNYKRFTSLSDLKTLQNYQGWKVIKDYDYAGAVDTSLPWRMNWKAGDVLVKISEIVGQNIVPKFTAFPQAMGGYYVPSEIQSSTTNITFKKQVPELAKEDITVSFPTSSINSQVNYAKFNSNIIDKELNSDGSIDFTWKSIVAPKAEDNTISNRAPYMVVFWFDNKGLMQDIILPYAFEYNVDDQTFTLTWTMIDPDYDVNQENYWVSLSVSNTVKKTT